MLKNASLRLKLLALSVMCVGSIAGIMVFVLYQTHHASAIAAHECMELSSNDLDHTLQGVYAMCQTQLETQQQMVDIALNVARRLVNEAGGLHTSATETVAWKAINQFTRQTSDLTMPKMLLGQKWLGQNADLATPSPVVDEVREITGLTCTIFQRVNDTGDMLRVATNVFNLDNKTRPVGTFIPRLEPNGNQNLVVGSLHKAKPIEAALLSSRTGMSPPMNRFTTTRTS